MTSVASCSPSLPEVSRRRAFGLSVLARLGKNSSVQKAVMTILRTPCERTAREHAAPSALAAHHHQSWLLLIWSACGTTSMPRTDVLCPLLIFPRHPRAPG